MLFSCICKTFHTNASTLSAVCLTGWTNKKRSMTSVLFTYVDGRLGSATIIESAASNVSMAARRRDTACESFGDSFDEYSPPISITVRSACLTLSSMASFNSRTGPLRVLHMYFITCLFLEWHPSCGQSFIVPLSSWLSASFST